jgi:hypothetical protein
MQQYIALILSWYLLLYLTSVIADRFNRIKPAIQRSCALGEEGEENADGTGAQ